MSFVSELYTSLRSLPSLEDLQFNLVPEKEISPWFVMFIISNGTRDTVLCDNGGGNCVIQFDYYSANRFDGFDEAETINSKIVGFNEALVNFRVWDVSVEGVRSFGTSENGLYRYSFDATFKWYKE